MAEPDPLPIWPQIIPMWGGIMKSNNTFPVALIAFSAVLFTACGGGGGGTSASTPTQPSATPTLSSDQKVFESMALAPSASYRIDWSLPSTGAPVAGTDYLDQQSYSMTASPLTAGPQTVTLSAPSSISATLGLPGSLSQPNRYVAGGQIVVGSDPAWQMAISYPGSGVQLNYLATDGKTVVSSQNLSNFSSNDLETPTPTAFATYFTPIFSNSVLINGSAAWLPGSTFIQFTATQITDVYLVYDYNGSTAGNTPNPVASGTTIAALMAAGGIASNSDGTTYTMASGTVSVINTVNTYVATNPRPNQDTTAYRTYYEINGNVYTGEVIKAGTVRPGSSAAPYQIEINHLAEESCQQGFAF